MDHESCYSNDVIRHSFRRVCDMNKLIWKTFIDSVASLACFSRYSTPTALVAIRVKKGRQNPILMATNLKETKSRNDHLRSIRKTAIRSQSRRGAVGGPHRGPAMSQRTAVRAVLYQWKAAMPLTIMRINHQQQKQRRSSIRMTSSLVVVLVIRKSVCYVPFC